MFTKSEQFYDAVYSWKNYPEEARRLQALIVAHKRSPGNALLDVACGTGGHVPYLRGAFAYEGLDLDPQMLAIARARYPEIPFREGDMRDFALDRQFDVVTCLFSSIAYAKTLPEMRQVIATMARHLRPGGVLIVELFLRPDRFAVGRPSATFVDQPDLKIARMAVAAREGTVAILDFHYLVATPDGVEHFSERHEMGLFTDDEYHAAFADAGLEMTHDAEGLMGRGVYAGVAPEARDGA
jgi:SAM-dependent methyltransferase